MSDVARCKKCVNYLRLLGLCPIPSSAYAKKPDMPSYLEFFAGTPVPESVYEKWHTPNMQILTGTQTPTNLKIVVVDCDGPESVGVWNAMKLANSYRQSHPWICHTGGGGMHTYFSVPDGVNECPSGMLWGQWDTWGDDGKGKWLKHKEVRLIADRALVVAPPSIHVETGKQYNFNCELNPRYIQVPEVAPEWLLKMPRLQKPSFVRDTPAPRRQPIQRRYGNSFDRDEVIQAIGDRKLDLVKSWGLIVAGSPSPTGWTCCYVPGREQPGRSNPSGSFNVNDGTLIDHKDMTTISFLDLAVSLGVYVDWRSARDDLGQRFLGKIS